MRWNYYWSLSALSSSLMRWNTTGHHLLSPEMEHYWSHFALSWDGTATGHPFLPHEMALQLVTLCPLKFCHEMALLLVALCSLKLSWDGTTTGHPLLSLSHAYSALIINLPDGWHAENDIGRFLDRSTSCVTLFILSVYCMYVSIIVCAVSYGYNPLIKPNSIHPSIRTIVMLLKNARPRYYNINLVYETFLSWYTRSVYLSLKITCRNIIIAPPTQ